MERRRFLGAAAAASVGLVLEGSFSDFGQAQNAARANASVPKRAANRNEFPENSTIVLVHAAWADGTCWSNIILPLERRGLNVICAPIPLTSLTNDATALNWTLERTSGPVVLVGHAYSGAVIAAVNEERIMSLVYVAALAPDEGETVAKVFYRDTPSPEAPKMVPDSTALYGCPRTRFAGRSHKRRRPTRQRSLPPCNGRFRFSAFKNQRPHSSGNQSRRGTWSLEKIA